MHVFTTSFNIIYILYIPREAEQNTVLWLHIIPLLLSSVVWQLRVANKIQTCKSFLYNLCHTTEQYVHNLFWLRKNNKMSTWTFKIVFPLHVNHDFKVLTALFVVRFTTLHSNHSRSVIRTDLRTQINHLKALITCSMALA